MILQPRYFSTSKSPERTEVTLTVAAVVAVAVLGEKVELTVEVASLNQTQSFYVPVVLEVVEWALVFQEVGV